jgi:poly(3-hydroxybutyrate) depolymerase
MQVNKKGLKVQCHLFIPFGKEHKLSCVVYLHGNSGSKLDGKDAVRLLTPIGVSVCTLDFTVSVA